MNTVYCPKGAAKEYGEYALNISMKCSHKCAYCYCHTMLRTTKEQFSENVVARKNIVEETEKFFAKNNSIVGKHIHLCFIGDPCDKELKNDELARLIQIIHKSGNFVQILTKGEIPPTARVLLTENDIFGTTITCDDETAKIVESGAILPSERLKQLKFIKENYGCKTFVSCEPVLQENIVFDIIKNCDFIDNYKIGKLNYHKLSEWNLADIDWKNFGIKCESLCKEYNRGYYLKDSLRNEMAK